jgi:hypothetical protein
MFHELFTCIFFLRHALQIYQKVTFFSAFFGYTVLEYCILLFV